MGMKRKLVTALTAVMTVVMLAGNPALAKPDKVGKPDKQVKSAVSATQGPGQAGTTLEVTKTAQGFWATKKVYDWSIDKMSSVLQPVITPNQSITVDYSIHTNRTLVSSEELVGVRGMITVFNGGERPTAGLKIVDQIQYKQGSGPFQNLSGATLTIIPDVQLQPGETKSYPYEIVFTPVAGATYRNQATVTITNHSGSLGQEKGPSPKADFTLPAAPTSVVEDATAVLTDQVSCPTGFTCEVSDPGPWQLNGPVTITYKMYPTNVSAGCKQIVPLTNTATLTESTTGQVRQDSNTLLIFTGCCECPVQ